jgi:hypothetical protein
MQYNATTIEEYIQQIDTERQIEFRKLFETIKNSIPTGFESGIQYKMPTFFVPHSLYPSGYHCDTKQPLPFIALAAQKNFLAFYHMGIYANPELLAWFTDEYIRITGKKPDMGKSCLRMKKSDDVPFSLLAELCKKISVKEWIEIYEKQFKMK